MMTAICILTAAILAMPVFAVYGGLLIVASQALRLAIAQTGAWLAFAGALVR